MSEQEREAWQKKADAANMTLADYIRERVNEPTVGKAPRRRTQIIKSDPLLVAAVARCGNNLNQIARWCNTYKNATETVQILTALCALERELAAVKSTHDS